jgi:hypothetical protein
LHIRSSDPALIALSFLLSPSFSDIPMTSKYLKSYAGYSQIFKEFDTFIIDLDGTIWSGDEL